MGECVKHTRPNIFKALSYYFALAPLCETAADQITSPNAILFMKSAKL